MYTLLVVDDEEEIRRGIVDSIDWEDWGFLVVGEASDGEAGLRLIDELQPDVVLSDIRMPGVDGVAIMQYVGEKYPEMKVIILSGFSDFEYLDVAIKNSIVTYLLKPTDMAEFEKAFQTVREKLDTRANSRRQQSELSRMAEESSFYMYSANLRRMIHGGNVVEEKFADIFRSAGMKPGDDFRIAVMGAEYSAEYFAVTSRADLFAMKEETVTLCNELFQASEEPVKGIAFLNVRNMPCALVSGESKETVSVFFAETVQAVREKYGVAFEPGISEKSSSFTDASRFYTEARMDIDRKKYGRQEMEEPGVGPPPTIEELADVLSRDDMSVWEEQCRSFFGRLYGNRLANFGEIDLACMKFLFAISDCADQFGISVAALLAKKGYTFDFLSEIESISGKRCFVEYCFADLVTEFRQNRGIDAGNKLAASVRQCVGQALDSPQLSLGMVADQIGRTPAYVSKMFKETTGISFVRYVRKKRMEYAASLLAKTNLKVYEVAEKVGYPDLTHFMKTFKKYYSVTPNEYRHIN